MTPRRIITGALLGAALAAAPCASPAAPVHRATRCTEDSACWNWRTMGNHRRGIYLKGGPARIVVTGPQFDHYRAARRIDWARTPHLKGD